MTETTAGGEGDRCRRTRGLPRVRAKDQNYRGSIQLASRHVKYYCPPRFIYSIFKRKERKALPRPPNIFHYWIILLPLPLWLGPFPCSAISLLDHRGTRREQSSHDFCHPVLRVFFSWIRARKSERSENPAMQCFFIQCMFLVILVNWLTDWPRTIKWNARAIYLRKKNALYCN